MRKQLNQYLKILKFILKNKGYGSALREGLNEITTEFLYN